MTQHRPIRPPRSPRWWPGLAPRSRATAALAPVSAALAPVFALAPVLALVLALAASPAAGQQPRTQLPPIPTVGADTVPIRAAPADTVPADTVLTPRQRALERLRALPTTPIEPPADTSAEAEGIEDPDAPGVEAADTLGADTLAGGRPGPRPWTSDTTDVVLKEADVRALLANLRGYATTEYQGEGAVFEGVGNRLQLMGESRVARDGSAMETDSLLVYRGDTGEVCGYGNPVLTGEADPVESRRLCYDISGRVGMAEAARTKFEQAGTWYIAGPQNQVWFINDDPGRRRLYSSKPEFTSCELEEPHYVFRAQSLKVVHDDVVVARNVTLRFADVPVFWLPWMVQSLKPDRRSGLLTPQFGVNDIVRNSTGYNRRISNLGYYWAINDYMSALVAGEWFSNNYTALEGSFTYRWTRQFLEGRLAVKRFWQHAEFGTGPRELSLSTNNSWRPDERTQLQVVGDYSTSTALVRDYSFDPAELNRRITSSASMNRTFDWGSMTLGANRQQQITDDQINWTLPSLGLTLRPLTLYSNETGTQNLTWSGRSQIDRRLREVNHELTPRAQGEETLSANASHSISFGRLSLSQGLDYRDHTLDPRPLVVTENDSIAALDATSDQELSWNTTASYQHTLWAGTTLSPSVSIRGRQIRDHRTEDDFLAEPYRLSAGAALGTTIFGFWPGFGDYERIRHKISPSLNWAYSPAPDRTPLQDSIFGIGNLRDQNRIGLSFNQTFEAKVRDRDAGADAAQSGADAAQGDADTAAQAAETDRSGEPRSLPASKVINLLSINTSTTFEYDFVRAREEGRGFLTEQVNNSLRSDLLPGFQMSITHELFETAPVAPGTGAPGTGETTAGLAPRTFSPYLTRFNASFSLDNDFWLLRLLGLGGDGEGGDDPEAGIGSAGGAGDREEFDLDHRNPGTGAVGAGSGGRGMGAGPSSGWRATLNYSLNRPRPRPGESAVAARGQQVVNGSLAFRPTEHWSVNWNTSYSFTKGEFDAHRLTLARDLHRWQANFDFIKAPNGNFAMQFRVVLLDNPDLKVEYDQRTDPSDRLRMEQP
jgi:hypothetical protein